MDAAELLDTDLFVDWDYEVSSSSYTEAITIEQYNVLVAVL